VTKKRLVLTDGIRERELQLAGRIVVGRDPGCEISHDHSLLSRRHAEFVTVGDTVTVRDLGSRNGVFVNGERTVEHTLEPDDVVQIGPLRARFVIDDAPTSVIAEAADGDRTAIIRKVFTGTRIDASGAPVGVATLDDSDDDVTRMIAAPAMPMAATVAEPGHAHMGGDGEQPTLYLRPPPPARPPAPRTASATGGLFHSILMPVLLLSLLVAGTSALPLIVSLPPSWLAVPILLVLAGSYAVALSINRRVIDAVDAGERDRG
jgi:hypothetical protein